MVVESKSEPAEPSYTQMVDEYQDQTFQQRRF
jgi:hypothetical protein